MGFSNSYALLMPVHAPLPIVSIKIGYNQYTVYCMAMVPGILADAAWLVPPDSVLPVVPAWAGSWQDAVKDVHFLASPVLNLFFIAGELIFIVLYYGFVRVMGRCKNEIEES